MLIHEYEGFCSLMWGSLFICWSVSLFWLNWNSKESHLDSSSTSLMLPCSRSATPLTCAHIWPPHVVTIHHSACRGDSPPPAVFGNHRAREATSHCLSNVFSSPSKAARPLRTSQPTPLPLPPHLFFLQIPSSFLSLLLSPFFSVCSLELTASPSSLPSLFPH